MNCYIGLIVAVLALIDLGQGQVPVTVEVSPRFTKYILPGDSLQLECLTNQIINFIVRNDISWFFKPIDASKPEIILTQNGKLKVSDKDYELNFESSGILASKLKIKSASSENTGDYICRAGSEAEGLAKVVVVKDVEHVELRIGDNPPVIGEEINQYEAEFHNHETTIECTASGSYPEANIELYLGDQKIDPEPGSVINTKQMESAFKSSIKANKVLYPKHTDKILKCVASVNLPADSTINLPEKVSSIPLHIITLVPLISCKNQTASLQDKYVRLTCDVSAEKPLKRLFWKLGYNNQVIFPGNKTEDYDEVRVEKIEGSDDEKNKRIILDIYKMKKEHFNSVFYLIVEDGNGEIYQEPVYIREYASSSNMLQSSLLTLIVLSIIALVKC